MCIFSIYPSNNSCKLGRPRALLWFLYSLGADSEATECVQEGVAGDREAVARGRGAGVAPETGKGGSDVCG